MENLAKQFTQAYYSTASTNKAALLQFYSKDSQMTYNGSSSRGLAELKEKLESLSYQTIQYQVDSVDAQ